MLWCLDLGCTVYWQKCISLNSNGITILTKLLQIIRDVRIFGKNLSLQRVLQNKKEKSPISAVTKQLGTLISVVIKTVIRLEVRRCVFTHRVFTRWDHVYTTSTLGWTTIIRGWQWMHSNVDLTNIRRNNCIY